MAKKNCSTSQSLFMILALFFILFTIFNVRIQEGYVVAAGPLPRRPVGRVAAKRAYIDANTYTPNVDITPFNNKW